MSSLSNQKAFADENILKLLNILFRYINKQNEKINIPTAIDGLGVPELRGDASCPWPGHW